MHPVRRLSEKPILRGLGGTIPPNEIRIRAENPGCERDEPGFSVLSEEAARRTFFDARRPGGKQFRRVCSSHTHAPRRMASWPYRPRISSTMRSRAMCR